MLLSNGSLGCCPPQAWHMDSKGPCPLPPAWSYEESTGWHDENKVIIRETPNVTMAIVVLWFHWNVFILATATSAFEQRNSARNGSDRLSDWSYQESTSCHMGKTVFLFLELLLRKKFPLRIFYSQYVNSLFFSKYFVQLFSSEHYVCLNICASAIDNLSVRLNPNVV